MEGGIAGKKHTENSLKGFRVSVSSYMSFEWVSALSDERVSLERTEWGKSAPIH